MKRYIYIFFMLMCIVSCEKPEEGMMPEKSVNANIVRFRIYQESESLF
ncbi:MAG: hypothetical protein ACLUE2_20630 [Bacteroides cellulosilyticus]